MSHRTPQKSNAWLSDGRKQKMIIANMVAKGDVIVGGVQKRLKQPRKNKRYTYTMII
jgi:hypothetical protein